MAIEEFQLLDAVADLLDVAASRDGETDDGSEGSILTGALVIGLYAMPGQRMSSIHRQAIGEGMNTFAQVGVLQAALAMCESVLVPFDDAEELEGDE